VFSALKLFQLSSVLKKSRETQEAYSAVVELGRIGSDKAVDLLLECLDRGNGVARSAARELGRLQHERAIEPLAKALSAPGISQSAAEALVRFGSEAVSALIPVVKAASAEARRLAADTLGTIGDKRAVEPLIHIMQGDPEYAVRTAAARALGELKDQRALWVIVGTLKLRDETTPERQAALEKLRQAASVAWRKIGDPLGKGTNALEMSEAALAQQAMQDQELEVHPRLAGELADEPDENLITVLRELITASEEVSWSKLENREAMLPAYFRSYDRRRETAEKVGAELLRRRGMGGLEQIMSEIGNYAAIRNWWNAAGLFSG
jgi:HEAT repeat protein